jgi:hypothetical protein
VFGNVPDYTGNDGMPRISLNNNGVKILTYVSYLSSVTGDLKVATQSGSGSWQVETVDPSKNFSGVVTAAINNTNQVMIVEERLDTPTTMKQLWSATTSLSLSSTSVIAVDVPADGTYRPGDELNFTVHFNEHVTVTGTPSLPVMLDSGIVQAAYLAGSGTSTLTFRYTVRTGDQDTNGIALGAALALNGGTIQNSGGSHANLILAGVPSTAGILVDAIAPAAPTITAPTHGSVTNEKRPIFSGNAEANSTVTIYLGGAAIGTTSSDGAGSWTFTPTTDLSDGGYSAQASARDAVGNQGALSAAISFTVDTLYKTYLPILVQSQRTSLDSVGAWPCARPHDCRP